MQGILVGHISTENKAERCFGPLARVQSHQRHE